MASKEKDKRVRRRFFYYSLTGYYLDPLDNSLKNCDNIAATVKKALRNIHGLKYSDKDFKKLQIIRFLDDWAYQANVRQQISETKINEEMKPFENKLKEVFNVNFKAKYSFPWNRLFEIEVQIEFN